MWSILSEDVIGFPSLPVLYKPTISKISSVVNSPTASNLSKSMDIDTVTNPKLSTNKQNKRPFNEVCNFILST